MATFVGDEDWLRTFLVKDPTIVDRLRQVTPLGQMIALGYLHTGSNLHLSVVRVTQPGPGRATEIASELIISGRTATGHFRETLALRPLIAAEILVQSSKKLFKERLAINYRGTPWVVDLHTLVHDGLCVAYCSADQLRGNANVPPWCGREITSAPEFHPAALAGAYVYRSEIGRF
jgi:CYTH domain-containing protein